MALGCVHLLGLRSMTLGCVHLLGQRSMALGCGYTLFVSIYLVYRLDVMFWC